VHDATGEAEFFDHSRLSGRELLTGLDEHHVLSHLRVENSNDAQHRFDVLVRRIQADVQKKPRAVLSISLSEFQHPSAIGAVGEDGVDAVMDHVDLLRRTARIFQNVPLCVFGDGDHASRFMQEIDRSLEYLFRQHRNQ
jgi:hypothetical protein